MAEHTTSIPYSAQTVQPPRVLPWVVAAVAACAVAIALAGYLAVTQGPAPVAKPGTATRLVVFDLLQYVQPLLGLFAAAASGVMLVAACRNRPASAPDSFFVVLVILLLATGLSTSVRTYTSAAYLWMLQVSLVTSALAWVALREPPIGTLRRSVCLVAAAVLFMQVAGMRYAIAMTFRDLPTDLREAVLFLRISMATIGNVTLAIACLMSIAGMRSSAALLAAALVLLLADYGLSPAVDGRSLPPSLPGVPINLILLGLPLLFPRIVAAINGDRGSR